MVFDDAQDSPHFGDAEFQPLHNSGRQVARMALMVVEMDVPALRVAGKGSRGFPRS